MKIYNFEVKFTGPYIQNILGVKKNLSQEEYDEVIENFFNIVYDSESCAVGFVVDDDFFVHCGVEAKTISEALKLLEKYLYYLNNLGLVAEAVEKVDLDGYDI